MKKRGSIQSKRDAKGGILLVSLPNQDVQVIQNALNYLDTVPPLTANQFLSTLQTGGSSSPLFAGIQTFLTLVEGSRDQTYLINGDMTIGVGLDITKNSKTAIALFYNMDSARDWATLFPQMLNSQNQPVPALSLTNIQNLLYYTLIGASYQGIQFIGQTTIFVSHLNALGLADIAFQPFQLVALQSMIFNGGKQMLGNGMASALKNMVQTHSDLMPVIEIVEQSNGGKQSPYNVGIQNRRLREAGLFHNKPADVHLTWRQYNRVSQMNPGVSLNGIIKWGSPIGDYQDTFVGGSSIEIISGQDAAQLDVTIFGTVNPDKLNGTAASPVVYGADANDILEVPDIYPSELPDVYLTATSYFSYYAGNSGNNVYSFDLDPGQVMIYDSNRFGLLFQNNQTIQGIVNNNVLTVNSQQYGFGMAPNNDGTYWATLSWTSGYGNQIFIPNYIGGQFYIAPMTMIELESDYIFSMASSALLNNKTVALIFNNNYESLFIQTYDFISGKLYSNSSLSFELNRLSFGPDIVPSLDGGFTVFWSQWGNTPNFTITDTLWQATYSSDGEFLNQAMVYNCTGGRCFEDNYVAQVENNFYQLTNIIAPVCTCSSSNLIKPSGITFLPPTNFNYTLDLNNDNILFLSNNNDESIIVNIIDKYGNQIGDSVTNIGSGLSPSIVLDNGDVIIALGSSGSYNFYYLEASAFPAPFTGKLPITTNGHHLVDTPNRGQSSIVKQARIAQAPPIMVNKTLESNTEKHSPQTSGASHSTPFCIFGGINYALEAIGFIYSIIAIVNKIKDSSLKLSANNQRLPHQKLTAHAFPKQQDNSQDHLQEPKALNSHASNFKLETCRLVEIDGIPTIACDGANYHTYVFPKASLGMMMVQAIHPQSLPITGDHYNLSSCKPVEFGNQPSVYCEGDNSTFIYTPKLPSPPFQNLGGNIGLVAVGVYCGFQGVQGIKWLVNTAKQWWCGQNAVTPKKDLPALQKLQQELFELNQHAELLRKQYDKLNFLDRRWLDNEVADALEEWKMQVDRLFKTTGFIDDKIKELHDDFAVMKKALIDTKLCKNNFSSRFFVAAQNNLMLCSLGDRAYSFTQNVGFKQFSMPKL